MTDNVSARAQAIRPFVVMDVVARAKELEAEGHDVVRMDVGDPDFTTPDVITRAAERAMEAGETGYTQSLGVSAVAHATQLFDGDVVALALLHACIGEEAQGH